MNVRETVELIGETRSLLIEDFKFTHGKNPTNKDLLQHIKAIFKEDRVDEIVGEVFLDEEELNENISRILLVAAAITD
jgi:hypothetical protein